MIWQLSSSSSIDDFPLKHRTYKRRQKREAYSMMGLAVESFFGNVAESIRLIRAELADHVVDERKDVLLCSNSFCFL